MSEAPILSKEAPVDAACRICHCSSIDATTGPLLSPCICDGSMRWVHRTCLNEWRAQVAWPAAKACHCEVCGSLFVYDLDTQSHQEILAPVMKRGLYTVVAILILVLLVMPMSSFDVCLCTAGALLGVWALMDAIGSARTLWRYMCHGYVVGRKAARKEATFGSVALNSLLVSWATAEKPEGWAQAAAQAMSLTEAEAEATRTAEHTMSRLDLGTMSDEDVDDTDDLEADFRPDGAVIFCVCCSGCCTGLLFLCACPVLLAAFARFFGNVFADPSGVRMAKILACVGAAYISVVGATLWSTTMRHPLPVVARERSGMPVVRSLTEKEREEIGGASHV